MLSEKCNGLLRPLKKKAFKEERGTTIGLYAIAYRLIMEARAEREQAAEQLKSQSR